MAKEQVRIPFAIAEKSKKTARRRVKILRDHISHVPRRRIIVSLLRFVTFPSLVLLALSPMSMTALLGLAVTPRVNESRLSMSRSARVALSHEGGKSAQCVYPHNI